MVVKDDFVFSQASLQDFSDCKRRFYYRYVEQLSWPAIEAEPVLENEKRMIQGSVFHQLVHRYYLGIPVVLLDEAAEAAQISTWWKYFQKNTPVSRDEELFSEKLISVQLGQSRFVAKFDLIAKQSDGKVRIFDWKTSRKRPQREFVAGRMQTKVYPLVASEIAQLLFPGEQIVPEQIEMIYWYVNYPNTPEIFPYSKDRLEKDKVFLAAKIDEIRDLEGREQFPLTVDIRHCRYCVYRSLCDRGDKASDWEEFDPEFTGSEIVEINIDEIEEIEI